MMNRTLKTLSAVFLFFSFISSSAQRSEIGFGLGTFNYTGDLVKNYNFKYSKPAATVFYRSNLSTVVSFRAGITAGKIGASEKPIDAFGSSLRRASFNLFLFEGSTVMEYHFLNWRETKRFVRFTPYLFAGLAVFGIAGNPQKNAEYSNVQASIPFGGGVKYVYNPKWYFALEFGVRKTWFDHLDNISEGDLLNKRTNPSYGNPNDNDSYYFLGITLTRTFYTIPCPTNPYK
jgi:hypothetical protein